MQMKKPKLSNAQQKVMLWLSQGGVLGYPMGQLSRSTVNVSAMWIRCRPWYGLVLLSGRRVHPIGWRQKKAAS